MARIFALWIGVAFLIIGVLGFILEPEGGLLLGTFAVDAVHNAIHVIVGVLGIIASSRWPRLYCEVLGIVYLLIGICAGSDAGSYAPRITPRQYGR